MNHGSHRGSSTTTIGATSSGATSSRATRVGATPLAVFAALAMLGGCATTSPQPPVTTVTVYPEQTTVGRVAPSGTVSPSSVPTVKVSGESATSTSATPRSLPSVQVGPLRGAPADYAQAEARVTRAPSAQAAAKAVQSPSRNIYCAAVSDGRGVACEVVEGRAAAPRSAPCPDGGGAKDVGRVELGAAGATPVCNSDTIRASGAKTLAYGKRWTAPGTKLTCLSEPAGVTCIDVANQHGFFIARETYATF